MGEMFGGWIEWSVRKGTKYSIFSLITALVNEDWWILSVSVSENSYCSFEALMIILQRDLMKQIFKAAFLCSV